MTLTVTTTSTPDTSRPSRTQVAVARDAGGGRVSVIHDATGSVHRPVVRPVLVSSDERGARVCLVPEGALLLGGDRVEITITVGAGARLELVEPAGTVAYATDGDGDGDGATWDVTIELGVDATLVWAGEPFVVAAGARVSRSTSVRLSAGARAALREIVVLGRHSEASGRLDQRLAATGPDGRPVLSEALEVGPHSSRLLLGGARVMCSVILLGESLPAGAGPAGPTGGTRFDLDGGGTLVRALGVDAHRATLADAWRRARAAVT